MKQAIAIGLLLASACLEADNQPAVPVTVKPFTSDWESLKQYQCPEWFRDAKLGIWSQWGPVAAPGGFGGNWYALNMYIEGHRQYRFNLEHFVPWRCFFDSNIPCR